MRTKFFIIVAAVLLAAVSVAAETGVAVIANDPGARAVAELMLPELSEDPNIALVERENVGSLFKEIEAALLAGNMRDISTKISMFGADMFAVLVSDKEIEGCSLTVFDAKSGVRLVDVALGSKDKGVEDQAGANQGTPGEPSTGRHVPMEDDIDSI